MQEENDLIAIRRNKLEALCEKGVAPYGAKFDTTGNIAAIRVAFDEGLEVSVAGRITAHRDMGNSHFVDISDLHERVQPPSVVPVLGS